MNLVMVCERFGWTLDYAASLDPIELDAVMAVVDAVDRGRNHVNERNARKRSRK